MNMIDRTVTTMTSREFNQDTARAKRAALVGPVFITDRGSPSHVLLSKADYDRLRGNSSGPEKKTKSLAEALDHPESADVDFDIPEFKELFKGVEFD